MVNRIVGLDIIRSLAVLFVVFSHGINSYMQPYWPRLWLDIFGWFGLVGVELFFALSGFLIGSIIIKNGSKFQNLVAVGHFWVRRWFRTLPNFYLYFVIHVILLYGLSDLGRGLLDYRRYIVFIQALAWGHPPFFAEAWSLAVEEWFYLLTPLSLWILLKRGLSFQKAFWITVLLLLTLPIALRSWIAITHPELGIEFHKKVVVLRLDAIMYGMVVAMLHHKYEQWLRLNARTLMRVGLISVVGGGLYQFLSGVDINIDFGFKVIVLSATPLGCALLLPYAQVINVKDGVFSWFVKTTALLSYSMYLCNLLVLGFVHANLGSPMPPGYKGGLLLFLLFLGLCYALSYCSYRWIEVPMLTLRDKVIPNTHE